MAAPARPDDDFAENVRMPHDPIANVFATLLDRASAGEHDIWMVEAIIQPFRLDQVTLSLEQLPGFGGMTVTDCRGFGRGKLGAEGDEPSGRAPAPSADMVDFTRKVKVEVAVAGREHASGVIDVIARSAHTGNRGDGKIFVWPLAAAVRVRTGDVNARAL